MTRGSRLALVATPVYLALVGILTLGPTPWRTGRTETDYDVLSLSTWLAPSTWDELVNREFAANIVMFVPLGLLLRLALPRATWVGATVLGGGVSLAIEVLQMWTPRVSDPRDIVANTAGALIGALLAAVIARGADAARSRRVDGVRESSTASSR